MFSSWEWLMEQPCIKRAALHPQSHIQYIQTPSCLASLESFNYSINHSNIHSFIRVLFHSWIHPFIQLPAAPIQTFGRPLRGTLFPINKRRGARPGDSGLSYAPSWKEDRADRGGWLRGWRSEWGNTWAKGWMKEWMFESLNKRWLLGQVDRGCTGCGVLWMPAPRPVRDGRKTRMGLHWDRLAIWMLGYRGM